MVAISRGVWRGVEREGRKAMATLDGADESGSDMGVGGGGNPGAGMGTDAAESSR